MGNMTVRNLPAEVHQYLRAQAKSNRRSLEAEVRSILLNSAIASSNGGFGHRIRKRYGQYLGNDLEVERDQSTSQSGLFD